MGFHIQRGIVLAILACFNGCRGELQASFAAKDLLLTGEEIQLSCLYSSQSSEFRMSWRKNDFVTLASLDCLDSVSACKKGNSNSSKFILTTDSRSFNLTIKDLTIDDSGIYKCTLTSRAVLDAGAVQLDVFSRAPPNVIFISDEISQDEYTSSPTITMTADMPYNVSCTSLGARPPVLLEWQIPTDVHVLIRNQSNNMQGDSYVSRIEVTVVPTKNDHGKELNCWVPNHNGSLHTTTRLDVQVPPTNPQIQAVGHTIRNETGTARLTIFENTLVTIICRSLGSRPVSSISWTISTRRLPHKTFSAGSNINGDTLFDSESVLELRPDRTDHYKFLRCTATARDHKAEAEIMFIVNGPPDIPILRGIDNLESGSQSTLTCTSNNGYPTPLVHWYLDSKNVTQNSTVQTELTDEHRVFTLINLTLIPTRYNHGQLLVCEVLHSAPPNSWTKNKTVVLNIAYSPIIVNISARRLENEKPFISIEFICSSDANPPATNFYWYHNRTILTNTTRHLILSGRVQMKTISTSRLLIDDVQPSDSGKYECQATTDIGNATATLNYTVIPDPPTRFSVDQNETSSSTLIVTWQKGFDGGLQQNFTLEYCPNNTQVEKEECNVVTNITATSYRLVELNPITWYRMTLWAVNSAGNSSAVEKVASTTPLQPESYGITTKWDKQNHILTLSEANQTLDEICFITLRTYHGPDCASMNETECVAPGTEVRFDPDDDPVLVTFGRGLCSKPTDLTGSSVDKQPSTDGKLSFITIALGVIASAGFILLISLGLMYFYGVLCCVKRKKDDGDNAQEGRTVDDDGLVYMSVSHDRVHPPNAPPIQTEEPTVYASLNPDVTQRRKGEMKYADTKATTPDGQPMYGNYLVKKRKQEQARMPPPIQTDDASYHTEGMEFRKGGMKGAMGPTTPDGQPMYGNYLVKMRKDEERAKQMAGTHDVFEMYGI